MPHRMRPLAVSRTVDAPRERVFEYLSDVANHAEFSDHYLRDFRLERLDSSGLGAAASWRMDFPLGRVRGDVSITEIDRPHRIVLEGRGGRIGRIPIRAEYRLVPVDNSMTRVEYEFQMQPVNPVDRLKESLGMRAWLRSKARRALRRMANAIEDGTASTHAVRPAAG
jgi:carbon monoxide dehydrogenase subunit G